MARSLIIGSISVMMLLAISPAVAQPPPPTGPAAPNEYAVKLVCGRTAEEGGFVPGAYATAINVHNPMRENGLVFKIALANLAHPGPMTGFSPGMGLHYDQAVEFDCRFAAHWLTDNHIAVPSFFSGFFVIQARSQLDVVAVYTAGAPGGPVASIHTERVPVRLVR